MVSAGIVSTLAEQVVRAKSRAAEARERGRDARSIDAIGRSLRRTLGCIVQIRDPREVAAEGFSLGVEPTGEAVLRHRGRTLPVSERYLLFLLGEAGVKLVPGQLLLPDALIVTMLVEEALGAVCQEEAVIFDSKSRLLAASREAESLEKGRPSRTPGLPSGAA
jgi:hypothetical protein